MRLFLSFLLAMVATTSAFCESTTIAYSGTAHATGGKGFFQIDITQNNVVVYITHNDDGTYSMELKNFYGYVDFLKETYYIGNISVPKMTPTVNGDGSITIKSLASSEPNIFFSNGDNPKDAEWLGDEIGSMSHDVVATINGKNLTMNLSASVEVLKMNVDITCTYSGQEDETLDISSLQEEGSSLESSSASYNLAGQKCTSVNGDILIRNGRKVLQK